LNTTKKRKSYLYS